METDLRARLEAKLSAQTEHPVYPLMVMRHFDERTLEAAISMGAQPPTIMPAEDVYRLQEKREKRIQRERADRFRFRCEPEMWRRIDLAMARKRLAHPGVQLELLVMGGIRGSKTDFTHSRAALHFFYCKDAWTWGLHETQTSSKTIQQARVVEFFPPELNPISGKLKKDRKTRMTYSIGGGFTGDTFTLYWNCQDENGNQYEGGGLFDFKFYRSTNTSLQGAELTCAVSDELIPLEMVNTVRERLLSRAADTRHPAFLARIRKAIAMLEAGEELPGPLIGAIYHGVHLIGFTPKEGYSATVSDFLDGAVTTEEIDAELLPGKKVPRFKQPKKATRLVAYLHTYDNAHKGNWPAMVEQCKGATEAYVRVIAYGDVSKGWSCHFAKYSDTVHIVTPDWIKEHVKDGTWYQVIDPHGERMWFMMWALCDPNDILYIVREAPLEGDFIPDIGDPGPWAITSTQGNRNGDAGDGQLGRGWGLDRYVQEMKRIEEELSKWWGRPINVVERIVDSRGGQHPTMHAGGKSTIFDDMADRDDIDGNFALADGGRLSDGNQAINNRLDFDLGKGKSPTLFVSSDCKATMFTLQNFGNPLKPKDEACKEPRDCLAYLVQQDPVHMETRDIAPPRGRFSY